MSDLHILTITRRSIELTDSKLPWQSLIENTEDCVLLKVIRRCSAEELPHIGYYAIALNRHRFLKWWWNRDSLPQITSAKDWLSTVLALQLYRLQIVKENPLQICLAIFKAPGLRKLYPTLLNWESHHHHVEPECGFNYSILNDVQPEIRLRLFLVELATALPNGSQLLYTEWKKYQYCSKLVWNFQIPYRHTHEQNFDIQYNIGIKMYTSTPTPLLQLCCYGNRKDFKYAIQHPEWWELDLADIYIGNIPLVRMVRNKNSQIFNYFMELVYFIFKVCDFFPIEIIQMIWNVSWISRILTPEAIHHALFELNTKTVQNWRHRVMLLIWLCPDVCTPERLSMVFDRETITRLPLRLNYCTYYHYTTFLPIHPNPEDVLWLETQKPLVSPKADGVYFCGNLPKCHPSGHLCPLVQAEEIKMDTITLYMVFDVAEEARWDHRITSLGKVHPYWNGPYKNLGEENQDLTVFLSETDEKIVWWPKGVYPGPTGSEFFYLLSQPPVTPYPNDGWIVAGNRGPFWKIKPAYQLTLDIMYTVIDGWQLSTLENCNDQVITEFPQVGVPIYDGVWRCGWDSSQKKWRPLCRRFDKTTANNIVIATQVTMLHKYPWNPALLTKHIDQRNIRGPKTKELRILFKKQDEDTDEFRTKYNINSVLLVNIGCGNQENCWQQSFDNDPYLVAEQHWLGANVLWVDASNLTNPVTGQKYVLDGTKISIQKIQYFTKTRESWLDFMSTISTAESLFITMLDANLVFGRLASYTFPDKSIMKRGRQTWHRGVWEGTMQLKWMGNRVVQEPMINYTFLKEELIAVGWKEQQTKITELGMRIMYWTK
uniref:mRNA capping enzyme n=1 Tax=Marseillevirus LCMAC201 TaxID=2506605 RepID=A0A481YXE4_9VIRU|nr:MAG: mRNA capping enzyme [Marseillevirus LCMAC201]